MVFAVVSGHPTKITADIHIVEAQMQLDDETTAVQLQKNLVEGHPLSLKTILALCTKLGWTLRGSAYYQLIRHVNKAKQLAWAQDHLQEVLNNQFKDVLWTDETSVCLSDTGFCCRKKGSQARPKPR